MSPASDKGPRTISFRYRIRPVSGPEREFTVTLDRDTLGLVRRERPRPPEWTRLGFHKCPNCTLDEAQNPCCPVALGTADLVELFQDAVSFEEVDVRVEGPARAYEKHTTMQETASALMGLVMATSGCPVLDHLRPMAATHLPFPSDDEMIWRVITMHLFAQYFLIRDGKMTGFDLGRIAEFYENEVSPVNASFSRRLSSVRKGIAEASSNAVSILDSLGTLASLSVDDASLEPWRRLFAAHFQSQGRAPLDPKRREAIDRYDPLRPPD